MKPARIVDNETVLFDRARDPQQLSPVADSAVEARLIQGMQSCLAEQDAPDEVPLRGGSGPLQYLLFRLN